MTRVPPALLASFLLVACGGDRRPGADDGTLVVMTRNLYLGAPLEPLLQLNDVAQLPAAVGVAWRTVQASDVSGRMNRVVEEIAAAGADVVALQEVALFQTRSLGDPGPPATVSDFLQLLLDGLRSRGYDHVAAGVSTNFDAELPDDTGQRIRFVDRDVVLVRGGVRVSAVTSGRYATLVAVSSGPLSVTVPRGWLSLHLEAERLAFSLVNTHLEVDAFPAVQEAQARELAGLLADARDLVLAGDLNSAADGSTTASYGIVTGAGFRDAWDLARPADPGLTCCFAADLRDPGVPLTQRIDLVLERGAALTPSAAEVVGAAEASRTPAGVHPSDHAGVVVRFPGAR